MAGATLRTLTTGLDHAAVVRAMPNTPSQIRRGITVWTASSTCTARQRDLARSVLRAIGSEKEVGDETFVAMATALSGTGPTYLFAVMEALIDAGVHMGFPRELAHDLVVETLIGSAEYAAQSELHPAQLRNAVTSPGGTSAAAIYELEKGRIRTVLSDAVWAAYRRTQELGERLEEEARCQSQPVDRCRWYGQADVRHRHGRRRRHAALALSRRRSPKQLLALTGDTSLLQQSVARLGALPAARHLRHHLAGARARHPGAVAAVPADNVLGSRWPARPRWPPASPRHGAARVRRGRPGAAGRPLPGR